MNDVAIQCTSEGNPVQPQTVEHNQASQPSIEGVSSHPRVWDSLVHTLTR